MAKIKSHKALKKRVTFTGSGKVLKRTAGQDHFNSREPGKVTRNKRRDQSVSKVFVKTVKSLIQNWN